MIDFAETIANQLKIQPTQVAATIQLLDDGNTLPFIARYRKEATGSLDEEQIRRIAELLDGLRKLEQRRAAIVAAIQEQGQLTPELHEQLLAADTLTALEDLYQPYRPKRRTRASMAREKGLQPLADQILAQPRSRATAAELAAPYVNDQVADPEEALAGARDIVAEVMSDHPEVRRMTRAQALRSGTLQAGKVDGADDPREVYRLYYDFKLRVDRLRPHQILALNRGEAQKVLRVNLDVPPPRGMPDWRAAIAAVFRPDPRSPLAEHLFLAAEDAARRLLLPAIERDVRRTLTEMAEAHAIRIFAANLRSLLSQPPLAGQTVLAIDPGFRTGCKVAVVDPTGKVLDTTTIYPHPPQQRREEALAILAGLARRYRVTLFAVGNGTASRETELLVAELLRSWPEDGDTRPQYLMVNEAGASVYSASPLARAELPDLDVSMRSAVSLARRVQDPLAELVKIDPKSIGVGMYQHDVDQKALAQALDGVVESVVNQVGVDVNTASPALLTYVAGIGPKLAERIVAYRDEHGPFPNRQALLQVPGLGPKAFQQAAGFLRIRANGAPGSHPLDASAIHPESYPVAEALLARSGLSLDALAQEGPDALAARLEALRSAVPLAQLAAELGTGEPTLADIFEQLVRPGRDPREDLPKPILRSDVLTMEDLQPGMRLAGTVRNVVDFGAFVDIGVKQDGLLHRSQIPFGTLLQVGDVLQVEILGVEIERGRISLGWAEEMAPA
ncbi:RNA-binding transcriptional accessory protein [Litorilinea aerophila]|uniref:RNA-binding transcriptional accessory protein n=1 Tax=Litorilinea aerophila TaxID=1204385 RepID=A0A540VB05_9CHLR|nr:Tex family protein [Litorilinea aerophila]MCC9078219.1 RNA-binding transcriptional accessory protein [Litorilinea aerophila]